LEKYEVMPVSSPFGCFFFADESKETDSMWFDFIKHNSAIAIPDVAVLANLDLEKVFSYEAGTPDCCIPIPRK